SWRRARRRPSEIEWPAGPGGSAGGVRSSRGSGGSGRRTGTCPRRGSRPSRRTSPVQPDVHDEYDEIGPDLRVLYRGWLTRLTRLVTRLGLPCSPISSDRNSVV